MVSLEEQNKWLTYFIFAVILAIFGMVIYMVTMDEKKEDRYYASLIFYSEDNMPLYPPDTGTLEGGIKKVRDAVANLVSNTSDVNFSVPHSSSWELNVVPVVVSTGSDPSGNHFFYTFPLSHTDFGDAGKLAEDFLNSVTLNDLFEYNAEDLSWATDVFNSGDLSMNLTYGTRDSVTRATLV